MMTATEWKWQVLLGKNNLADFLFHSNTWVELRGCMYLIHHMELTAELMLVCREIVFRYD